MSKRREVVDHREDSRHIVDGHDVCADIDVLVREDERDAAAVGEARGVGGVFAKKDRADVAGAVEIGEKAGVEEVVAHPHGGRAPAAGEFAENAVEDVLEERVAEAGGISGAGIDGDGCADVHGARGADAHRVVGGVPVPDDLDEFLGVGDGGVDDVGAAVSELAGGREDGGLRLGAGAARAVEDARGGRGRDAGAARDVAQSGFCGGDSGDHGIRGSDAILAWGGACVNGFCNFFFKVCKQGPLLPRPTQSARKSLEGGAVAPRGRINRLRTDIQRRKENGKTQTVRNP